ncbi:MAG: polyprenyl diphosphate synthase [Candidatus Aenigmatarchaeota archaeon]
MLPVPNHVAIIMDGNRRWAERKSLPPRKGHEEGEDSVEKVLEKALDLDIKHVTFWALSLDNIEKRSREEVEHLMDLFEKNFKKMKNDDRIHENEVRINVLGRWKETLPDRVVEAIEEAMEATKDYSEHFLNLLVAYSGRDEMLEAIKGVAERARKEDVEITSDLVKENLYTSELPEVDLMIRTGGEPHNSTGFMMWDVANSQYYFSEKLWPEFGGEEFERAVTNYRKRERRFGG